MQECWWYFVAKRLYNAQKILFDELVLYDEFKQQAIHCKQKNVPYSKMPFRKKYGNNISNIQP